MSKDPSSHDQEIIKILRDQESRKAEYPAELMAARRASFLEQVAAHTAPASSDELTPKEQQVVNLLKKIREAESGYPPVLWAGRRLALRRQIKQLRSTDLWDALRTAIKTWVARLASFHGRSFMDLAETSMLTIGIALVAFLGFALYANGTRSSSLANLQPQAASPIAVLPTSTSLGIICKNGYQPPLCLAGVFDSDDVTYQGNGLARPAVAKDSLPGRDGVHRAAYVNDGLYGPGASWVSASPNSWIKIDLGQTTAINAISFGRDRLGKLNDRDPGQFVISVAVSDNVYADGNSSYDELEYVEIYNSEQAGFDGVISGNETVMAYFDLLVARFIKITFENAGTAIDEVEAFVVPTVLANHPTKTPREPAAHTLTPTNTPTPWPTSTPVPTDTPIPTDTPPPTDTPLPTDTPVPTETATPIPTETALPTDVYYPYATPMPMSTGTVIVESTP